MAAFVDAKFGTATIDMPAAEHWSRGTESVKDSEVTPSVSPTTKQWEPLRTGEPADERERGEYLRGIKQPSQTQQPKPTKPPMPLVVAPGRSGNTERIELSRAILGALNSIEASLGQLSVGSQIEDFKRKLASAYSLLNGTFDSAQFLTVVSLVEEKLAGTDLTEVKDVIPTLRFVFRLCFERPHMTDADVSTVRAKLEQLDAKSVPLFLSDEELDDEADDPNGEEEA